MLQCRHGAAGHGGSLGHRRVCVPAYRFLARGQVGSPLVAKVDMALRNLRDSFHPVDCPVSTRPTFACEDAFRRRYHLAAPSTPLRPCSVTRTGTRARKARTLRPCRKRSSKALRASRAFIECRKPPARYTPPVAMKVIARLPAKLPSDPQKISAASTACASLHASAAAVTASGVASRGGSFRMAHRVVYRVSRPGPDTMRSNAT